MQLVTVWNEVRGTGRLLISLSDGDGTSPGRGADFGAVASAASAASRPPLPRYSRLFCSFNALLAPDAAEVSCVKRKNGKSFQLLFSLKSLICSVYFSPLSWTSQVCLGQNCEQKGGRIRNKKEECARN